MIKTTFSNGFTDQYKGKRDVTAGWALIEKATGEIAACGHSRDRAAAEKTASATISAMAPHRILTFPSTVLQAKQYRRALTARGVDPAKTPAGLRDQVKRWNWKCNSDFLASHSVEIVDAERV